jgi:16S rRNA G527 N7-methylase RsmG
MVESKTRKAAFLREVVRELDIEASVEAMRFEDLAAASGAAATADLVTVRAVRVDDRLVDAVRTLLRADGRFALFGTLAAQLTASKCFTVESSVQLLTRTTGSHLTVLVRST